MKKINDRKSNKNKLTWLTISLLIVIIFFTCGQVLAQYKTGLPAPEFALEALDGEVYQLSQFNNKQNHLLLCFVKSDDSFSIDKLQDMISFFKNYQPKESYQIIAIFKTNQDKEQVKDNFLAWQDKTDIPILILLDDEGKAEESYQIERYPTILLLRSDLHIRRAYDKFTNRQETSFYQYLSFLFTSQKSSGSNSSGCDDDGVCPPPPGY